MICWRVMAGHGGDYEFIVRLAYNRTAIPSAARDLSNTARFMLCWKAVPLSSD